MVAAGEWRSPDNLDGYGSRILGFVVVSTFTCVWEFWFSNMVFFLNSCKKIISSFSCSTKFPCFFIYFYNKPSSIFMNIDLK